MDVDDVVIGSGLAALGATLGLPAQRRIIVLRGPAPGHMRHYDGRQRVPCEYLGYGGLGNYWHGVIPTGMIGTFDDGGSEGVTALARRFYPSTDLAPRLGRPGMFVPWLPIRPRLEFERLVAERSGRLMMVDATATRIELAPGGAVVDTDAGRFRARRAWVAAGALSTPTLLSRSFGQGVVRGAVSDHAICYLGQVDAGPSLPAAPRVVRTRNGILFDAIRNPNGTALCTLRPARFSFRRLDHGIEARAAFGLPTGGAIAKIVRAFSAGLLAEALYNRTGLAASASRYNVYGQILVRDAYDLTEWPKPPRRRDNAHLTQIDAVRDESIVPDLKPSRRRDIFIPGIHLHHSLDLEALAAAGINEPGSAIQVVDASALDDIGPEHHSFRMMAAAFRRAAMLDQDHDCKS